MKFKHKSSSIKKKKTRDEILHDLKIKEKDILKYISLYNLYKLGIVACGIDPLIKTDILLDDNIIFQKDIDKNMEDIKEKIANGESNSKICEYYSI